MEKMLTRLFNDDTYKDIIFELDSGIRMSAHRNVLYVSCVEWFQVLLKSSFKESSSEIVRIKDCSSKILEIAIKCAYEFDTHREPIKDLFEAANKFMCPFLINNYINRHIIFTESQFVAFIVAVMKYPYGYDNILKQITICPMQTLKRILLKPKYVKHTEEIMLFILEKCQLMTETQYTYFLTDWLDFNKEIRSVTIELLKHANIISVYTKDVERHKKLIKKLISLGYYDSREVDKFYKYPQHIVIQKYPLKIGNIEMTITSDTVGAFVFSTRKIIPIKDMDSNHPEWYGFVHYTEL